MSDLLEVIRFARRMVREVRNGFRLALHWLMQLRYPAELAAAILGRA
jgi:hypothetical protein